MLYTGEAYTLDYWKEIAKRIEEMGADSICIKDMAGLLVPYEAEALVKEYFEAMAEKDMDRLDNIFYQKDILKCFAVSNDMTEEKVLESLKEQVDKLELTYKEESISDYSAYPEIYVDDMNDSIYKAIGKENVIKYMYSISIKYVQHTTIGWEEKRDSIKVYVIDDGYYIWPSTGEEK